jgi:hypothetical protein
MSHMLHASTGSANEFGIRGGIGIIFADTPHMDLFRHQLL